MKLSHTRRFLLTAYNNFSTTALQFWNEVLFL